MQYQQWRAFIGARWIAGNVFYRNFTTLSAVPNYPDTTVQTTINGAATTIVLVSAATWPNSGHAWIGGNGSGEGYEYITYTGKSGSTLTGVTRESAATREHNGNHTAGAVARVFWPITTDTGQLQITEEANQNHSLINWRGQISGVMIPTAALRNRHLILIEKRATPAGAWQLWRAGWLSSPTAKDDYSRRGAWTAKIGTTYDMIAAVPVDGIRIGETNLARAGSASGATTLTSANKERHSGDYTAGAPNLDASAAVDGDPATLWIAEKFVGTDPPDTTPAGWDGDFASMIRYRPFAGEQTGGRYIEWLCKSGTYNNASIYCKSGAGATVNFDGIAVSAGDRLIICEDESIFRQQNPLSAPKALIEILPAFFDALDTTSAGDAIGIWRSPDGWSNCVSWGTYTNKPRKGAEMEFGPQWPANPPPAVPTAGQVIRYRYNAAAVTRTDHFLVDFGDLAAYHMGGGDDPHILIELPAMGLITKGDITAGSPGAAGILLIWDGTSDTTSGLDSSGTIQIGSEQITYSAKSATGITVTARGANGTTAAGHPAGDTIYQLDGATATDGHAISRIKWTRPSSANVPKNFIIRRSNRPAARVPSDNNHEDDYELIANVTNHASAAYTLSLSPSRRSRFVILEIGRMTIDFSRPRVNEIEITLDDAKTPAGSYLPANTQPGALIRQILVNAGIHSSAISHSATTPTLDGFTTARDAAGAVAVDVADFTGARIRVTAIGDIVIEPNPTNATQTSAGTWTRDNARSIDTAAQAGEPIRQVQLTYQTTPRSSSAQEVYPAAAAAEPGIEVQIGPKLYAGAAAAQAAARREYIKRRYPTTYAVELATAQEITPGSQYRLTWQLDAANQPLDRYLIITSTDHQISALTWQTVISGQQADREADY